MELCSFSNQLAEEGAEFILNNKIEKAISNFTRAIKLEPLEMKHYLNRSYCFLRLNMHPEALQDAEYVIQVSKCDKFVFIANLRAGQALTGLEKLQKAEACFTKAVEIYPKNIIAERELLRTRVTRIANMGYRERDAILALEKNSSTLDAMNYLYQNNYFLRGDTNQNRANNLSTDDLVYESDDDEFPDNIVLMNRILKHQPKFNGFPEKSLETINGGKSINNGHNSPVRVGNLTKDMSNAAIRKMVKVYGNIIYKYGPRRACANHALLNFETKNQANKFFPLLISRNCLR